MIRATFIQPLKAFALMVVIEQGKSIMLNGFYEKPPMVVTDFGISILVNRAASLMNASSPIYVILSLKSIVHIPVVLSRF